MRPKNFVTGHRSGASKPTIGFENAEEAWFWFMRTEKARAERAKAEQSAALYDRPCLPDDVYSVVSRLHCMGMMFDLHLQVMGEYGYLDRPPDPDDDIEAVDWVLWIDAFETLEPYLIEKRIVD